jgi:hypothetical protein
MKVFLDTSYILPLVGVDVKGAATSDEMLELLRSEDQFCMSQLSLFEALGKARTLVRDDKSRSRIQDGLTAILGSERLELLPVMDDKTVPLILDLLSGGRKDLPDVVIMASAMVHAQMLLTEAKDIPIALAERGFKCTNLRAFLS